jgi:glycosyltransferase involved in cell wall biosynthesis
LNALERTRVLYVINDLARAGAETQLVELVRRLDRAAFEPRIVMLKSRNAFAQELEEAGVRVTALARRGWCDFGVVSRLAQEVEEFRPDIVHSWLFLANLVSALAVRRGPGRRLILSQRCSYEATAGPFLRRVARWSHRRADRVIVNSRAALEEEVQAGFSRTRIVHVPNGVGDARPPSTTRAALGLTDGPLAVSVGQLQRMKGHHVLLEAWPAVRARVPDARLVLVGSGPQHHALADRARRLGLADAITLAGFRSPAPAFIAAADVFVQPSSTEGMPNAVLEAMALGRPIVASAVGGIPELIEDGVTGLLMAPNDPGALSDAIVRLLVDRDLGRRLGKAAALRARERFSWARVVAETEAIYREPLGDDGPRPKRARPAAPNSTGPTVTP